MYTNTFKILKPAAITFTHIDDITAALGATIQFHVDATNVKSYQWEFLKEGTWKSASGTGNNTATMTYVVNEARYTFEYRCKLTAADGSFVYTNTFKILKPAAYELDGVIYAPLTETTCMVVSYAGSAASLEIPQTVQGMTVTEIGEEAFMGNTTLESIGLPDTIEVIHARAFKNCTNLSNMH